MGTITRLIIEFSREQARHIGEGLVSRPGHAIPSLPGFRGITLSDDNLAVSSPYINEKFSLRFNQVIAEEMGGVAVDCSASPRWDPTPMTPEMVRAALGGTGIAVKACVGGTPAEIEHAVKALAGPDMRLILDIARIDEDDAAYIRTAESNYKLAAECLARAYRS